MQILLIFVGIGVTFACDNIISYAIKKNRMSLVWKINKLSMTYKQGLLSFCNLMGNMEKIADTKLDNFPELTEDELSDPTMGICQLKQAKSYMDDHVEEKGSYEIMADKEN